MTIRLNLQLTYGVCSIAVLMVTVVYGDDGQFKLDPLPNNATYASENAEYKDGGMAPLFDFARSFINSALPGGFDKDFVEDEIDNGFEVKKIKEVIKKNIGYVIAIAIGFLFVLIFPIVGTCFCCCRLCGNCGGKRVQADADNIHCRRRIYSCVMVVITIFILVGNICTYVSNNRLSEGLDKIGDTVEKNLQDIDKFLDELSAQINTMGVTNLQKTKRETFKYMDRDDLKNYVSDYILNTLSNGTLDKMDAHIKELGGLFDKIGNASTQVDNTYKAMCASSSQLCASLPNPMASGPMFDLVNKSKPKFDNFRNSNSTGTAKQQIITKVEGSLQNMLSTKNSVNQSFEKIGEQVQTIKDKIDSFRNDTKSGLNIESMTDKTKSATDEVKKFDKYRHAVGASLAAMITLIAVLQFLGIGFGIVGQGTRTAPTDRGCMSNSGGNLLMASVVFIFIFSSLLMLLTTLCFSVGAIVERFFCQPLSDPQLTLLEVAGKQIPGDLVGNASFADIMLKCKNGETVYEAFPLLRSKFNITKIQEKMVVEKKNMNQKMSDSMKNITSSVTSAKFVQNATRNLADLNESLSTINYDGIQQQRNTPLPPGQKGTDFKNAVTAMIDLVAQLKPYKDKVGDWSNEFKTGLTEAENKIGNTSVINQTIQQFLLKITDPVDLYVNTTKTDVETNMGKCSPLWNMYNSIVIVAVCQYTIDAFNGFWFSIGWCLFFFVPGVVIAVKLAKHYRRMDDGDEEGDIMLQPFKHNQVAPSG